MAKKPNILQRALISMEKMQAKINTAVRARREPIAIVGMSCRFPGAPNLDSFWDLLKDGREAIADVPADRWAWQDFYDENPDKPGKIYAKRGGFLDRVDGFDARFFGIAAREAHAMDPQHRLVLEVGWEALENAGIAPTSLSGGNTGVFLGIGLDDYKQYNMRSGCLEQIDAYTGTGTLFCAASGRLSYLLGLQGPNLALDTACSSSLVSLHLACQSLRAGECDLALAGGVHLMLAPEVFVFLSRLKALSPDGRCKTFDAAANGYVRGEGCGMLALKRLSDAQADGNFIHALVRGTAVNHDGHTSGLTVPNQASQERLLNQGLKNAGLQAQVVDYFEAHGTGTPLGDPIEAKALGAVFGKRNNNLLLGSVKTNIGHLEAGAGVAGVIKLALMLKNRFIPASLNFKTPNPYIPWDELPLEVASTAQPWRVEDKSRVAAVSSFGISGTNAFAVLEEAPAGPASETREIPALYCLSAKDEPALQALVQSHAAFLKAESPWPASAATVCTGRSHFDHRMAVVAATPQEAAAMLAEAKGEWGVARAGSRKKIAFVFTGQGSQYLNMGRVLYQTEPLFKQTMDQCDEILKPHLEHPLRAVIYPEPGFPSPLNDTAYTQPALFAVEYALARLWHMWGLNPDYVLGHSVGEYTAACLAGVFSLENGLRLIAERGRLMQSLPAGGGMTAVFTSEDKLQPLLSNYSDKVSIAAVNGPTELVISGQLGALEEIAAKLKKDGIKSVSLKVSHAFHSPLMDPILNRFHDFARDMTYHQPGLNLISNLDGGRLQQVNADYWRDHLRGAVRFMDSVRYLAEQKVDIIVEIGPKPTLSGLIRKILPDWDGGLIPSLRSGRNDNVEMYKGLAACYTRGVDLNFSRIYPANLTKTPLPTYPFQRERFWLERTAPEERSVLDTAAPFPGKPLHSPLLDGIVFERPFSGRRLPFLRDHQLHHTIVVPGASHLSLVLDAAKEGLGLHRCLLTGVSFSRALLIDDLEDCTVQLVIEPTDDGAHAFRLFSSITPDQRDAWTEHATGLIHADLAEPNHHNPQFIQAGRDRLPEDISGENFYAQFDKLGYQLGPCFQWIQDFRVGPGETIAKMRVPDAVTNADQFQLYPGLADACYQVSTLALPENGLDTIREQGAIYVPFGVDEYHFYGPPQTQTLWCHAVRTGTSSAGEIFSGDIHLYDDEGRLIMASIGLRIKRAPRETLIQDVLAPKPGFHKLDWLPIALEPTKASGAWLLVSALGAAADALADKLEADGVKLIRVEPGEALTEGDGSNWRLNLESASQWNALFQRLSTPLSHIIWFCDNGQNFDRMDHEQLESVTRGLYMGPTALTQTLAEAEIGETRLYLITQGAQHTNRGEKLTQPQQSMVWGFGRVFAVEHPNHWGGLIDIDPREPSQNLYQALTGAPDEDHLALRGSEVLAARLHGCNPHVAELDIKPDGTYLVSGGLGGLGLEVVSLLASRGAGRIVPLSRREPNAETAARLAALAGPQTRIEPAQVDVSDPNAVAELFANLRQSNLPIRGIIHAAGVLQDGLIQSQNLEKYQKVAAPKVTGTWNLHRASQVDLLDFFICFSAAAGALGMPGQSNYAAANNFLDGLCQYRRDHGQGATAICWGAWAEVGMAARMSDRNRDALAKQGMGELPLDWGMSAMERAGREGGARYTILSINWSRFVEHAPARVRSSLFRDLIKKRPTAKPRAAKTATDKGQAARLVRDAGQAATATALHQVALLVAEVLGLEGPDSVRPAEPLFDAGLDSLMAVELRGKIQHAFDLTPPSTVVFDYPTITQLAGFVVAELGDITTEPQPKPSAKSTFTAEDQDLDGMSEDQLTDLLDAELDNVDQFLED